MCYNDLTFLNNMNKKLTEKLIFILPSAVIKQKHLRRKDVNKIKDNITSNFTIIRILGAAALYILSFILLIFMGIGTGWKQIEVYGIGSITSQIVSMFACLVSLVLSICGAISERKNKENSALLGRLSGDILFVGIAAQLLLGLFSDAEMGYTTQAEALSASVILITLLVLIQPAYWTDAIILDLSFTAAFLIVCSYCVNAFGMKAFHYYILLALFFPICCYFVVSVLFYAECQHYRDLIEKERLNDKAYYDHLTQCKNRYALSKFLKENQKRWENRENVNLLIILFDVDNFKEYNDQFSHLGGDYCLKSISDAVRRAFPSPGLDFFRYGGEEFLLFFELEDSNDAPKYMEEVRRAIAGLDIVAPKGAPKEVVTVSIGGLLLQNIESFSFEEEMALVDSYLYKAKAAGKDVSCYNGNII